MKSRKISIPILFFLILLIPATAQGNQTQEDDKQILVELDDATWISTIDWNPPNRTQVKVYVHSEVPKLVSLQEIPDYSGRSGSFSPMQSYNLQSGQNILYVPYNGRSNSGIAITDSNDGAYYQRQPDNIPDPSSSDTPLIAIYGALSTFLTFIVMRKYQSFRLKRGLIKVK